MSIHSEPRKFLALPWGPSRSHIWEGGGNLLALQFQYVVALANCNKASIKRSSADSLARNKIWADWWEAPLWWEAWSPALPPGLHPKSGPAVDRLSEEFVDNRTRSVTTSWTHCCVIERAQRILWQTDSHPNELPTCTHAGGRHTDWIKDTWCMTATSTVLFWNCQSFTPRLRHRGTARRCPAASIINSC